VINQIQLYANIMTTMKVQRQH